MISPRIVRALAVYTIAVAVLLAAITLYRSDSAAAVLALFVLPPALGGVVALSWPSRLGYLAASILVGIPAVLSLIGGLGILLLPPALIFLLVSLRNPKFLAPPT